MRDFSECVIVIVIATHPRKGVEGRSRNEKGFSLEGECPGRLGCAPSVPVVITVRQRKLARP